MDSCMGPDLCSINGNGIQNIPLSILSILFIAMVFGLGLLFAIVNI